jgi:Domain of unknown function (DUF5107)
MSILLDHTRVGSWEAIMLANDAMRVVVVPELGGKIVSLVSCLSGREWLWRNVHLPLRVPPSDPADFGPFDTGGWDEIFPTITPCQVPNSGWGDRKLTDHGDLWCRPWRTVSARLVPDEAVSLTLAVDDPALPFRFERTLTMTDGSSPLTADYEVVNRSDSTLPYLWAAHPLLAIEPGDSIRLPAGTRIALIGSLGVECAAGTVSAWPTIRLASGETLDLSRVPDPARGFAMKLFAHNVSPGSVQVVERSQAEFIRLSFDPIEVRHVGLWLNYGSWSGAGTKPYLNAGIEPTTSPHDDLSVTIAQKTAMQLLEGQSRRWQLTVLAGEPF